MTLIEFAKKHTPYTGHDELTPELFKKYIIDMSSSRTYISYWIQLMYRPMLSNPSLTQKDFSIILKLVESGYDLPFVNCSKIRFKPNFFIEFIQNGSMIKCIKYPNLVKLLEESSFRLYDYYLDDNQKDTLFKITNIPPFMLQKFFTDNLNGWYSGKKNNKEEDGILFDLFDRKNELTDTLKTCLEKAINPFNPTQVLYGTLITGKRIKFYGNKKSEFDCKEIPQTSLSELSKFYTTDEIKKIIGNLTFNVRGFGNNYLESNLESFIFLYENSEHFKTHEVQNVVLSTKTTFAKDIPNDILIDLFRNYIHDSSKKHYINAVLKLKIGQDDYYDFDVMTRQTPTNLI